MRDETRDTAPAYRYAHAGYMLAVILRCAPLRASKDSRMY
jgi:hypothetical protein